MFRLKSLVLCLLCGVLMSSVPASGSSCFQSDDVGNNLIGGEDDWPWAVVDLWKNIEGVWVTEAHSPREFYRFEIKKHYGDGALAVKIDVLHPEDGRVIASYMSLGNIRSLDLRTVVKVGGKSHFLRVKAYDRSRTQCRSCSRSINENIVLGMVLTPCSGELNDRQLRLLKKAYDL